MRAIFHYMTVVWDYSCAMIDRYEDDAKIAAQGPEVVIGHTSSVQE
jgi:hypothetical protein